MSYVYDPNHGASRQNVDSTIANYYQFQSNSPAISTAPVTYLDASNDQGTSDDNVAGTIGTAAGTGIGAYFGGPLGAAVGGAIGNAAGTALSHASNEDLQSNQFRNQVDLQRRAYQLNDLAVKNQAMNEVIGMRNAGINPAPANGQGAPSLQAGAAAGANSQVANIFSGMADMILAAKAPTEIERMSAEADLARAQATKVTAETGKVEAETEQITDFQNPLLKQQADKAYEDTVSAKNANDLFESQKNFLQSYTPTMFDQMMEKYKKDGTWETMSPKTRDTIEALADGTIGLDQGSLEGFKKLIDAEVGLSDADKQLMSNGLASNILARQLNDKAVQDALAKMPDAQYKKLNADMAETWQHIRNMETSRTREEAQKHYDWVQNKLRELDSPTYLHNYGTWQDEKQKFVEDNWQAAKDIIKGAIQMGVGAGVGGFVGGKVAGKAASQANKPNIAPPSEADVRKYGNPSETFYFGPKYRNDDLIRADWSKGQ